MKRTPRHRTIVVPGNKEIYCIMRRGLYLIFLIIFLTGVFTGSHAQIIKNYAGNGFAGYSGDGGPATAAQLDSPTCLAAGPDGSIYIGDQFNNRVRKVRASGTITTVAGTGVLDTAGDGGPATNAHLAQNWGVAVDGAGNIYISDPPYNQVRKVSPDGIITTVAGNGAYGYSGDGGPATDARLRVPLGLAVDAAGNLYIGDADNHCVRKVGTDGIISTYAGVGGLSVDVFSGDGGPAVNARFGYIWGLATDVHGNLYICDGRDNDRVRKVDAGGIITTIAGDGGHSYTGDGVAATATSLNEPIGVYALPNGVVYIADCHNNRIRKIDKTGIITTIAGTGTPGYNGEGIPAAGAQVFHPVGVYVDTNENVYFSDLMNARVRTIINILGFVYGDDEAIHVCANSTANAVNTVLSVRDVYVGLSDNWSLVLPPVHGTASVSYGTLSTGGVLTPTGCTYTPDAGYTGLDSFDVRVMNSLSSDVIRIYVSVDPMITAGTIVGPDYVCVGDTIYFTNAAGDGAWVPAQGHVATAPASGGSAIIGLSPGADTVVFTIGNSCGSASTSKAILVHALPDAGTVSGPDNMCVGSTAQFTASVSSGAWSTLNINASVDAGGKVTGVSEGATAVIYTVHNTWCTAAAIHLVDIETFPSAGTISGAVAVCVGASTLLKANVENGAWSSTYGNAGVFGGVVTGIAPGIEYIKYSVTNSCGTDVTTWPITVYALPDKPEIAVNDGLLAATAGYSTYEWYLDGAVITGQSSDSLSAEQTGVYQVVVSNGNGCKVASDLLEYSGCDPADLLIYPNPARQKIYLKWCQPVYVQITASDGKLIGRTGTSTEIDISYLPAGVYFLQVFDKSGQRLAIRKITHLH